MKPKSKEIAAINLLLKSLQKDFIGKERCEIFEPSCGQCSAQTLEGYLEWLKYQYES